MRTDAFDRSKEPLKENLIWPISERTRALYFMDSGFRQKMLLAHLMLNRIYTYTSDPESFYLSSSSRDVKRLNINYWIFMVLSCITFFTCHWSLFLCFLIPALIMNHIRTHQFICRMYYSFQNGDSTSGI